MLLLVEEARQLVETDISTASLKVFLDAAEIEITRVAGSLDAGQVARLEGCSQMLYLPRAAAAVTKVDEIDSANATKTLATSDYALRYGGRALERLNSGANPASLWACHVEVTLTPVDDTALRKRVQLDLVKLAITYTGFSAVREADFSFDHLGHNERAAILRELVDDLGVA